MFHLGVLVVEKKKQARQSQPRRPTYAENRSLREAWKYVLCYNDEEDTHARLVPCHRMVLRSSDGFLVSEKGHPIIRRMDGRS